MDDAHTLARVILDLGMVSNDRLATMEGMAAELDARQALIDDLNQRILDAAPGIMALEAEVARLAGIEAHAKDLEERLARREARRARTAKVATAEAPEDVVATAEAIVDGSDGTSALDRLARNLDAQAKEKGETGK